uniref:Wings apart-like protein C-terminal domain-containing protein n=1 Tax=Cucumis melo TaxID=3656 RepID=A0A9I9CF45_CUCME
MLKCLSQEKRMDISKDFIETKSSIVLTSTKLRWICFSLRQFPPDFKSSLSLKAHPFSSSNVTLQSSKISLSSSPIVVWDPAMIVRTYGRRNRGLSRTFSDSSADAIHDSFTDSLSQESSQDPLFGIAFSSQDSSTRWSTFDSEPYGTNSSQGSFSANPIRSSFDDSLNGGHKKSKKIKIEKKELEVLRCSQPAISSTSTLMEAQEFGEMMEHVDEVNFALDGLRNGQQVRIRRAILRSNGGFYGLMACAHILGKETDLSLKVSMDRMARTIIDAVLGLSFDDSASNLAAATLFYILTSDGQDDHLLESPNCVSFLIKLLKPILSMAAEAKGPRIGHKLLVLRTDSDILPSTTKKLDSSSSAIFSKVEEILVSCKEIKSRSIGIGVTDRPELCPKWIALLTIEKACLTTISLEGNIDVDSHIYLACMFICLNHANSVSFCIAYSCESPTILSETSGAIRKTGGNFKEKLRELGGLDAVFEVAKDCHSNMEICSSKQRGEGDMGSIHVLSFFFCFRGGGWGDARYENFLQSLMLLLKCLKIMENATFLSKENQSHLLGIKRKLDGQGTTQSFTAIMLCVIKILSGLYLRKSSAAGLINEKSAHLLDGSCNTSKEFAEADVSLTFAANRKVILPSCNSKTGCNTKSTLSDKSSIISQNMRNATARLDNSLTASGTTSTSLANTSFFKMRQRCSTSGSSSVTSRSTDNGATTLNNQAAGKTNLPDPFGCELSFSEDQDPFAFDEGDFEPSKWEVLSQKEKKPRAKKGMVKFRDLENGCNSKVITREKESLSEESHPFNETSSLTSFNEEEGFGLVADCLLTSIKVLMNLTNDNHVGCQQIASCGGLETMCSLIANHFPSFCSSSSTLNGLKVHTLSLEFEFQNEKHLTDQELDFLVAILGLLVNLVEKDGHNRSRLASASVLTPSVHGPEKVHSNVIPLLCSIFLANQGASDGVGEGESAPWNEEVALLEGEKEAEKMIVEAYSALLLAFLSTESQRIRDAIVDCLPDHSLAILVPVLERFVAFHLTLNMISPETHKAVTEFKSGKEKYKILN